MTKITVMDWQRALLFTHGRFVRELGPGLHRYRGRRSVVHVVDARQRVTVVPGQELLTADAITVKVSVLVLWAIDDALAFVTGSANSEQALYAQVQLAVRDAVAALTFDGLITDRARVSAGLTEATAGQAGRLGIRLEDVTVRDLMLPAELRRAAAETLLAREQGRGDLERARAEAAALRALANTARLLQDNPALLQLRTIQAAATPGSTIVFGADAVRPLAGHTPS